MEDFRVGGIEMCVKVFIASECSRTVYMVKEDIPNNPEPGKPGVVLKEHSVR